MAEVISEVAGPSAPVAPTCPTHHVCRRAKCHLFGRCHACGLDVEFRRSVSKRKRQRRPIGFSRSLYLGDR